MTSTPVQFAIATALTPTYWWAPYIAGIHYGAAVVATVCGAVVGVAAVYRLFTKQRRKG